MTRESGAEVGRADEPVALLLALVRMLDRATQRFVRLGSAQSRALATDDASVVPASCPPRIFNRLPFKPDAAR